MAETTVPLNIDPVTLTLTGTVTIPSSQGGAAPTQRGYDAVEDLGMDNTGAQDCAPLLQGWIDNLNGERTELHFPPGDYRFDSTVETNAKGIKLVGDGVISNIASGSVAFFSERPLPAILWWNCDQTASNLEGPWIEGIQFQDRSLNNDALTCAVRMTNIANSELKIGFLNMQHRRYTAGSVSVETSSRIVTGNGVDWTEDMAPGWIVIDGYPYEIMEASGESLTLGITYQGETDPDATYAINYHGIGVWMEPGLGFSQYGKEWSLNGRIGCALFCSAGNGATGTSRIKVLSGYLNGESLPDSMAAYLGPFSDTVEWHVACNSYAFGVVVANGHQHQLLDADYENAGGAPPVTGRDQSYDSCHGVLIMSDNPSDCWGNRIGGYFRQVGTGIELYGLPGKAPTWTHLGVSTFRSNRDNFVNGNATNTQGDIYTATRGGNV